MRVIFLIMIGLSLLRAEFIRNDSQGVVLDTTTFLQWQDNNASSSISWVDAIEYCKVLNLGGYTDWRLANKIEMNSIVDVTITTPPLIDPVFQNTEISYYWSSTTYIGSGTGIAWVANYNFGNQEHRDKTLNSSLRCVRGSNSNNDTTIVTAVDGYIKDATITDSAGQSGIYTSNGKYTFATLLQYPLALTGGSLEDTNASFDINMTAQTGLVISPITTFLDNNTSLQTKLATALSLTDSINSFTVDFISTNDTDLGKLSQLLYVIHKDVNLTSAFKTSLAAASPASLDDIFTLAEEAVDTTLTTEAPLYRSFLTKVKSLTQSVSTYESLIKTYKVNLNADLSPLTYNTTTYEKVISPFTGNIWLDRNLGASRVATAFDDNKSYGYYYQWGREHDGHQEGNSTLSWDLATDLNTSTNSSYIVNRDDPHDWLDVLATDVDDNGILRAANLSKTDGTFICPVGYRVPTAYELKDETTLQDVNSTSTAFTNFLKIPAAGYRYHNGGPLHFQGARMYLTSVTNVESKPTKSGFLWAMESKAGATLMDRGFGIPVRCIKH